jgi:uncharacterized protein
LSDDNSFAASLRGFGSIGLLTISAIVASDFVMTLLAALLVLLWAYASKTPWREIGHVRPRNWMKSLALGAVLGGLFKLAMKAVVMPLFGADPINRTYHSLVGNRGLLLSLVLVVIVNGGFGEETLFRGYLFERLGKLLGTRPAAKIATVVLTASLFAAAHYPDQGLDGAKQAAVTGLAFGTTFALTGRLFAVMIAHASFDLVALAIIYWDLEVRVAHLVFP